MTVATDVLRAIANQQRPEPGEYFRPNSRAQFRFWTSPAPELLFSSAYGKGKSRVLCEKAHWLASTYPRSNLVLARKLRAHMGNTTLRTLLDEVISPLQRDTCWKISSDGGSVLLYPNGSRITAIGLDNPGRARSGAFSGAFIDQAEELDEEEWNAISGRLRLPVGPYRQLAAVCNPDDPSHFLFKRFRPDLGTRRICSEADEKLPDGSVVPKGTLRAECILSGPTDNYDNLPYDYMLRLGRLSGKYKERYVEGRWVAYEGMIYDCFDPWAHVIEKPADWERWGGYPPPSWPRYRGIDFGYVNPFVCLWLTRSPEGTFYVYRELYYSQRTVRQHADQIKRAELAELQGLQEACGRLSLPIPRRLAINLTVADHDREDMATLEECGIVADAAIKEREPGIQTVYELLQPSEGMGPGILSGGEITQGPVDLRARLYIVKDCQVEIDPVLENNHLPTKLADEMPAYRRRPDIKTTSIGRQRNPIEEPQDRNDHACDALRYVLHTLHVSGEIKVIKLFKPGELLKSRED